MYLRIRETLSTLVMVFAAQTGNASPLLHWNDQTLYSQSYATDLFSDVVSFNVVRRGFVGVGVSFRDWDFLGHSTVSQFDANLIDDGNGLTVASNFGSFAPNIGGTFFINPINLPIGTYTAKVSVRTAGTGLLEVDVQSTTPPYATLAPASAVPEPTAFSLVLLGLLALGANRRLQRK